MLQYRQRGFTLIELVVTLMLVSILAVTVAPRFFGSNAFQASITRDALITQVRAAQQARMAGQMCQVQVNGSQFILSGDCAAEAYPLDNTQVILRRSGGDLSSFSFSFDRDGSPNGQCSASGCRIEIIAGDSAELCIEAEGYAHDC
ncbi:type II secretion system protein [uncultured Ferrimonas sp.]|uniref:type II secretion system protein n=1 Tax=uncultured Ferrimonas sp. TaxID=432640 RepID=UPI00260BDAEF|nr:type II secretion system protein [uncultured Ferrimonas sp.]